MRTKTAAKAAWQPVSAITAPGWYWFVDRGGTSVIPRYVRVTHQGRLAVAMDYANVSTTGERFVTTLCLPAKVPASPFARNEE